MPDAPSLAAALAARARGDDEAALAACLALLADDPEHLAAAAVADEALRARGRVVPGAAARITAGFLARGDLAAAAHAARVGDDPGALRAVAEVFGAGSPRLGDVPPPLPASEPPAPARPGRRPRGAALLDAAEDALRNLVELAPTTPADGPVAARPLFSELAPGSLAALLGAFEPRTVDAGVRLLEEGAEGDEAFLLVRGTLSVLRGDATLARLGAGALVGELGLVAETPRAATVRAETPAQLLVVRRPALDALGDAAVFAAFARFTRARLVDNLVRSSRFFQPLAADDVAALVARFTTRAFDVGDLVARAGDEPEGLLLVASGRLRVDGVDATGDRVELGRLGPGDVVGEMSLVLRRPVGADVTALSAVVALALSRADFEAAVRAHPTLLRDLYEVASARDELTRSVLDADLPEAVLL